MNEHVIWNYEDVESNLLAIEYAGKPIGYFRIDKTDFVVITDHNHDYPNIPLDVLKQIVSGYEQALETAKKITEK